MTEKAKAAEQRTSVTESSTPKKYRHAERNILKSITRRTARSSMSIKRNGARSTPKK